MIWVDPDCVCCRSNVQEVFERYRQGVGTQKRVNNLMRNLIVRLEESFFFKPEILTRCFKTSKGVHNLRWL